MTRGEFAEAVYSYCELTGASETAGYRTKIRNDAKKGVAHSAHRVKLAADVTYDRPLLLEDRRAWARRLGLKLVPDDDHDHLEPVGWEPK